MDLFRDFLLHIRDYARDFVLSQNGGAQFLPAVQEDGGIRRNTAVQQNGAQVTSVNNAYVLLPPLCCDKRAAHPPNTAPPEAVSIITPSNIYNRQISEQSNLCTREENVNAASKPEEKASLQGINVQNASNIQNANRELAIFPPELAMFSNNNPDDPSEDMPNFTHWAETRKHALKEGDFNMATAKVIAMPIRYGRRNANPKWIPLTHDIIKDFRQAIKDSGLSSPYFKQLLKGIFNN